MTTNDSWQKELQDAMKSIEDIAQNFSEREKILKLGHDSTQLDLSIKRKLNAINSRIESLERVMERHSSTISEKETKKRIDMVDFLKSKRKDFLKNLKASQQQSHRSALLGNRNSSPSSSSPSPNASKSSVRGKESVNIVIDDLNSNLNSDSDNFNNGKQGLLKMQKKVMKVQDEEIDGLSVNVRSIRTIAETINSELTLQAPLLDELNADVDSISGRMRMLNKKVGMMKDHMKDKCNLCYLLLVIIVASFIALVFFDIIKMF